MVKVRFGNKNYTVGLTKQKSSGFGKKRNMQNDVGSFDEELKVDNPQSAMILYEPASVRSLVNGGIAMEAGDSQTTRPVYHGESVNMPEIIDVETQTVSDDEGEHEDFAKLGTIGQRLMKRRREATTNKRSTKVIMRSLPIPVSEAIFNKERFVSAEAESKYKVFRRFTVIKEKLFTDVADKNVKNWIKNAGLLQTLSLPSDYDLDCVVEFWANFPSVPVGTSVVSVFVRGYEYKISGKIINDLFGLPDYSVAEVENDLEGVTDGCLAEFVSAGKKTAMKSLVVANDFSKEYQELYKVCCSNWYPVLNMAYIHLQRVSLIYQVIGNLKFNLGRLIFANILSLHPKMLKRGSIMHPSLIWKLINEQHPVVAHQTLEDFSNVEEREVKRRKAVTRQSKMKQHSNQNVNKSESSTKPLTQRETIAEIYRLCKSVLFKGQNKEDGDEDE